MRWLNRGQTDRCTHVRVQLPVGAIHSFSSTTMIMMLSKLLGNGPGRTMARSRYCRSLFQSRISVLGLVAIADESRIGAGSNSSSSSSSSSSRIRAGRRCRLLSTTPSSSSSLEDTHIKDDSNKYQDDGQKIHRRSTQKPRHAQKLEQLMAESKKFLQHYETLNESHRTSQLQQLLQHWGYTMPYIRGEYKLKACTEIANALAHLYLEHLPTVHNFAVAQLLNPAIHGWAKVSPDNPDAALHAEELLVRLVQVHAITLDPKCQPQLQTYNGVLDAWSKSTRDDAPERAQAWLQHLIHTNGIGPDRISYNCVLNVYASRGNAIQCSLLFDEMKSLSNPRLQPDKYSFATLIKAWKQSGSSHAAKETLNLLKDLKQTYHASGKQPQLAPNASIYSIVISLQNGQVGQQLLEEMIVHKLNPRVHHFGLVMNALAREGKAEQAEGLFFKMMEWNSSGMDGMTPNLRCFSILINAWCKHGSPQRAHSILERMEELFLDPRLSRERINTYAYNAVMNAYVRYGEKGTIRQSVQEMVDHMTKLGLEHNNPDVLPDRVSYTTLLQAWIHDGGPPNFAEEVEALLRNMMIQGQDRPSVRPDVVTFGCALDAWSKSRDPKAAQRAEALLQEMQDRYEQGDTSLEPNDTCFNAVINAYSKAGNAEQAESILRLMEESFKKGNKKAKADAVSYSSCIDAWARCTSAGYDAVHNSQYLFSTMVDKYKHGDTKCAPTPASFSSLMMVLANSKSPKIPDLAKKNLQVMQDLGIPLNNISCNALIHACSCATPVDAADALELAITTFHTMRADKRIGVDTITYNSLLHVASNLISNENEKQAALEDIFLKCKEDGMTNSAVIATMERFALPATIKRLELKCD